MLSLTSPRHITTLLTADGHGLVVTAEIPDGSGLLPVFAAPAVELVTTR
jgi:hypothetical protein